MQPESRECLPPVALRKDGPIRPATSTRVREDLHVLGERERVSAQRRLSHGFPAGLSRARCIDCAAAVSTASSAGRDGASDHAPTWITL